MLAVTAALSALVGEVTDASIILVILLGSALLGFWQERQAADVVESLLALIRTTARIRRDGAEGLCWSGRPRGEARILRAASAGRSEVAGPTDIAGPPEVAGRPEPAPPGEKV
jgi:hypothetical protein